MQFPRPHRFCYRSESIRNELVRWGRARGRFTTAEPTEKAKLLTEVVAVST